MKLKHALNLLLLTVALKATSTHAMPYDVTKADTLLVFRQDGLSDVVFNIGSISNLLALPNGATTNIAYNTILVSNTYNGSFTGVNFIVAAANPTTSSLRYWITSASASTVASNLTVSPIGIVRGKIESVGSAAAANTGGNASPYVVSATSTSAYTYIVTDGSLNGASTFNGSLDFTCEATGGNTMNFWQCSARAPENVGPARLVGSFAMNATTGAITYTSGTNAAAAVLVASRIVGITRSNGVSRVSFTTTNGNNYRLLLSTNLVTWFTNAAAGTVVGNNATNILNDTNGAGRVFYRIQSF